ncbi:hemerythrin domain-containing protein [Peptostreptococcus stomatis]|uniref:hemerythrin domain-containing protein n=1 Tax=Peptostreptococcus stomatis TaxID=341694 RepID=UPI0028F09DC7|nr:hemerythrin domain-containing protein [Peptostreptococcus stomatis]
MYGIDLLVAEHQNILKFVGIMKSSCKDILDGKAVEIDKFRQYIDFARNYADKHHHGKEEEVLFKIMVDELPPVAEKLIRQGMLVEHDLGRLFMANLEEALNNYEKSQDDTYKLDIIANAVAYGDLLARHIDKEDRVVYTFAIRELSDDLKKRVDEETRIFEERDGQARDRFESWLESVS